MWVVCVFVSLLAASESSYLSFLSSHSRPVPSNPRELRARLRLYNNNMRFISLENARSLSYSLGENQFTDLSDQELASYHGLNVSLLAQDAGPAAGVELEGPVPDSVDWVGAGHVTPVKDQGKCGSCWAFGSVVALEGAYKKTTGVLKNFAEQEYLDCAFTTRDGCTGGATHVCFDHTQRTGHMASSSSYPYTATDKDRSKCDLTQFKNSMIAAKVTGRVTVRHVETEENAIKILALQPVTMFIEATRTLHAYKQGILMDRTCWSETNHAVAGVAYTPRYIVVKNSWGQGWGESGFFRLMRGWTNCGLYLRQQYPIMQLSGEAETEDPWPAADYDHSAIVGPDPPRPDPDCSDAWGFYCKNLSRTSCHNPTTRNTMCRKTCNNCWIE